MGVGDARRVEVCLRLDVRPSPKRTHPALVGPRQTHCRADV